MHLKDIKLRIVSPSHLTHMQGSKQQLIYRSTEAGSCNDSNDYLLSHFIRQVMGWVQTVNRNRSAGTVQAALRLTAYQRSYFRM